MITSIDTAAPVVVHLDIDVSASLRTVWDLHTDVANWPSWQPDITAASTDGPLGPGSVFHWSTHGMDIASTVHVIEPASRILWGGPAHGITGRHLWTFSERDTGDGPAVRVHTEESWDGEPVRADVEGLRTALRASLTAWLGHLQETAENA